MAVYALAGGIIMPNAMIGALAGAGERVATTAYVILASAFAAALFALGVEAIRCII